MALVEGGMIMEQEDEFERMVSLKVFLENAITNLPFTNTDITSIHAKLKTQYATFADTIGDLLLRFIKNTKFNQNSKLNSFLLLDKILVDVKTSVSEGNDVVRSNLNSNNDIYSAYDGGNNNALSSTFSIHSSPVKPVVHASVLNNSDDNISNSNDNQDEKNSNEEEEISIAIKYPKSITKHPFFSIYNKVESLGSTGLVELLSHLLDLYPENKLLLNNYKLNCNKRRVIKILKSWIILNLFADNTETLINDTYNLLLNNYKSTVVKLTGKQNFNILNLSNDLMSNQEKVDILTIKDLDTIKQRMDCDRDGLKREREERIFKIDDWNKNSELSEFNTNWNYNVNLLNDNGPSSKYISNDMWMNMALNMIKMHRSVEHNQKILKNFNNGKDNHNYPSNASSYDKNRR